MAGISPQHRGGSNATTIGMVISIVVSVVLLGVLIWLFTMQEQLRNDAELAQKSRERTNRELTDEKKSGALLVGGLTGNQNDMPDGAIAQLDSVRQEIAGDKGIPREVRTDLSSGHGAVTIIKRLHELYRGEKQAVEEKEKSLEQARKDLEKARTTNQKLEDEFGGKAAEFKAKYEELQEGKKSFESSKNDVNSALARQLEGMREELNQKEQAWAKLRKQYRAELAKLDSLLNEQRVAIQEFRGPTPPSARPLATARKATGAVMRALPGDSLVHIDLGRDDGVTHGMTLSVYSRDENIPDTGRGKASIEVVSLGQRTSECRVVSPPAPGDPIFQGDKVGNIVLSSNRNKTQRFCVVGDFDVDFDGQVDLLGRKTIISLIERWGGEVVDEVDAMTDFLVIGKEPPGEAAIPTDLFADTEEEIVEDVADDEYEDDEYEEEDEWEDEGDEWEDEEDEWEDDEDEGSDDDWGDEDEDDSWDDEDEDEDEDAPTTLGGGGRSDGGPGGDGADGTAVPGIMRKPQVDPTKPAQTRRYRNEGERYRDSLLRAKYFSVPVLRQDQFFNFIGIEGTVSDVRRLRG